MKAARKNNIQQPIELACKCPKCNMPLSSWYWTDNNNKGVKCLFCKTTYPFFDWMIFQRKEGYKYVRVRPSVSKP
jgi:hypothetical protein